MTFAASAVQTCGLNVDVWAKWRGTYASKKKAEEIRASAGSMLKLALRVFNDFPQIHKHSAKRGDVVLMDIKGEQMMGVCVGAMVAVLGAKRGLEFLPIKGNAVRVWAIGHK